MLDETKGNKKKTPHLIQFYSESVVILTNLWIWAPVLQISAFSFYRLEFCIHPVVTFPLIVLPLPPPASGDMICVQFYLTFPPRCSGKQVSHFISSTMQQGSLD